VGWDTGVYRAVVGILSPRQRARETGGPCQVLRIGLRYRQLQTVIQILVRSGLLIGLDRSLSIPVLSQKASTARPCVWHGMCDCERAPRIVPRHTNS
jgi:hypothetical protein